MQSESTGEKKQGAAAQKAKSSSSLFIFFSDAKL